MVSDELQQEEYSDSASSFRSLFDPFFEQVLAFNLFPASYAHPSWLATAEQLPGGIVQTECASFFWMRHLSLAILQSNDLKLHYDFDFSEGAKRIALLDHTDLLQLGILVGSILARPHLRKMVLGDQIRSLNSVMGEEMRQFALRTNCDASLIDELSIISNAIGKYLHTQEHWHRCAMKLVLSLINPTAYAIHGRLLLKFKREWRQTKPFKLSESQRKKLVSLSFLVLKQQMQSSYAALELDR